MAKVYMLHRLFISRLYTFSEVKIFALKQRLNVPFGVTYLNQPYPIYYEGRKLLQICSVLFGLVLFFNFVIRPFNVNYQELRWPYFWVAFVHSLIPIIVIGLLSLLIGPATRQADNWTVKKELVFIFVVLVTSGLLNFLVRDLLYTNPNNWQLAYLQEEVLNTLVSGILLATLVVSINLNVQFLKNQARAVALAQALPLNSTAQSSVPTSAARDSKPIIIETEVQSETFALDINQLLYAQADGNYVNFYFASGEKLLKRLSLKKLEGVLQPYPKIMRTHRSYLLNLDYVGQVSGNAQGYTVSLKNSPSPVLVSRNYIPGFNKKVANR